jgi:hypothetical protein
MLFVSKHALLLFPSCEEKENFAGCFLVAFNRLFLVGILKRLGFCLFFSWNYNILELFNFNLIFCFNPKNTTNLFLHIIFPTHFSAQNLLNL